MSKAKSSPHKVFVVLLDDEAKIGAMLNHTIQSLASKERELPPNLELKHFQTSAALELWCEDRDNREATAFFIIDKHLDVLKEGSLSYTENGLQVFSELRTQYVSDFEAVDFAVFSGDQSLTDWEIRSFFPPDAAVTFLPKPVQPRDVILTYQLLLEIMLRSSQFLSSVKQINGPLFDSTEVLDSL